MKEDTAFKLISKLIHKTKNHSIKWKSVQSTALIKPFTSKKYSTYLENIFLLDMNNSYYADYNGGQFFLIIDEVSRDVTLIVQIPSSSHSMIYASTVDEIDTDIISELKRLYNLVDSIDYDISAFVDEFINQD